MTIRVGNAPVSWGVYTADQPSATPWNVVLDAIAASGYEGVELGPYGYFPADPAALALELRSRGLRLGSSYIGLNLADGVARNLAVENCLAVASLLHSQNVEHLILADDGDTRRAAIAGRVQADDAWSAVQLSEAAQTLDAIARVIGDRFDMRVVIHHHAGTFIETFDEITRILEATDPARVGLLIDTGHAVYGGADPLELQRKFRDRVWYVHLKDVRAGELALVRGTDISASEARKRGVFCPLGQGVVDFAGFVSALRSSSYGGWAIVEQDIVADEHGVMRPDPFVSAAESRVYLREKIGL